jgi:hypothetical protein
MRAWACSACFVGAAIVACGSPTSSSKGHHEFVPVAPSATSSLKLHGSCVDPESDARLRLGADAQGEGLRVEHAADLDGDGVLDPFVTHEVFCGTGGCDWHLYVARASCAVHVGELFAVLPLTTSTKSLGLFDLVGSVRNGCAGMARTDFVASFDGARYRIVRERACTCPDLDEGTAPDPDATCEDWHAAAKH